MQGGDWLKVAGGIKRYKMTPSQNLMLRLTPVSIRMKPKGNEIIQVFLSILGNERKSRMCYCVLHFLCAHT